MNDEKKGADRRTAARVRALLPLAYAESEKGESQSIVYAGRTLDISESGMKIETHGLLTAGQSLTLEIAIGERILRAEGEVLYVEPLANGQCATGIRFTSISEADLAVLRETIG